MRYSILAALSLLATPALAAPWVIDPSSTLTFTGKQAGETFTGHFTKFTPVVEFDPAKPEAGGITVTVDMASATIADKDKQDSLPTEDWFNTPQFPTASFISSTIKKTGDHTYEASGRLTLHGVSQLVTLPFTLKEDAGKTIVDGKVVLKRNEFGVGSGQWKDDQWIAYPVDVTFHLIATPGKD